MPFRIEKLPDGDPVTYRREHLRWKQKKGFTYDHPAERAVDDERGAVLYLTEISGGPGHLSFCFRLFVRGAELYVYTSADSLFQDGKVQIGYIELPSRLLPKRAAIQQIVMDGLAACAPLYMEPRRMFRSPDGPPLEFIAPSLGHWHYQPALLSPAGLRKWLEGRRGWQAWRRLIEGPWVRSPLMAAAVFCACAAFGLVAAPGPWMAALKVLSGCWLAWRLSTYNSDYNLDAWLIGKKPHMLQVMLPLYEMTSRMLEDPVPRDDVVLRLLPAGTGRLTVQVTNNGRRSITLCITAREVAALIAPGPVPEPEQRPFRFPEIWIKRLRPGRSRSVIRLSVMGQPPVTRQVQALIWTNEGWRSERLDRCLVWVRFDDSPTPPAGS